MDILTFNKFVPIRALAARRLEVESKLGLLAILNLDWTVKNILSNSNEHRGTCCRVTSTACLLVQVVFFFARWKLSIPWQSTVCVNRYTSHTAHLTCGDVHSLSAHHTWCYTLTRGSSSSSSCAFHKIVIPSLAQCLTPCTEHAAHLPHLFPLFRG